MTAGFFLPAISESADTASAISRSSSAQIAYSGLVKMHAQQLLQSERFKRTGRLTPKDVHEISSDLTRLGRAHLLDVTVDRILCEFDALELQSQKGSA